MRRADVNKLLGFRIDQAADYAAAGKQQSVWPTVADDGQFKVTIKRRCGYGLPIHAGQYLASEALTFLI